MSKTLSVYQASGFNLLDKIGEGGLRSYPVAASTSITKGDYVVPSSGYASTATAVQAAVLGIAAEDADNSSGSAGAIDVKVIPLNQNYQFSVPVATNAVIAQSYVGETYDLEAAGTIDLSDTTITAGHIGFLVDDFDASAKAVAANTYGYAIGHFQVEE